MQDDANGWKLRVSPDREASEERGDWARYTGDVGDPNQDLYYNTVTGEKRTKNGACSERVGRGTDTTAQHGSSVTDAMKCHT